MPNSTRSNVQTTDQTNGRSRVTVDFDVVTDTPPIRSRPPEGASALRPAERDKAGEKSVADPR